MMKKLLRMEAISKEFPGVKALNHVDFAAEAGEVHGIVGENGAGKSTLMKILSGAYSPDSGRIILKGKQVHFSSTKEAQKSGISIVHQEFNLISQLDIAENIFLGHEITKVRGLIDSKLMRKKARKILESLGVELDVRELVENLAVAQKQMVEIAKAISLNSEIIIMDEPSAPLSGKELDLLFNIIASLREKKRAIIYISHRIDEVFEITDRITVLKDGEKQGEHLTKQVDKDTVLNQMVGREFKEVFPNKDKGEKREVLKVSSLRQGSVLKNISFEAYSGEILGIAGLGGSGRTELVRAIFGVDSFEGGDIYVEGKQIIKHNPKESISRGIGFATEDRNKEGLVMNAPVRANLTYPILSRISKWGFVKSEEEKTLAKTCVEKFNIATPSIEQEVQYLSGGNQQKVIVARWINANPKIIILDEPTRGIDVAAKSEMYRLMRELAVQGASVIMISSELPEIIGMSDRIIVLREGEVQGELSGCEATEENVVRMATGQWKLQRESK
ncbi:MAG: sugar ABC transporter ATP-binding protein [Deltaproteobacteria bacterium]|nr:sugar ABC transporter ATP-binding protein [Deltaproteobacteria bacterium]MBW2044726.1 sugar ABC transporter ATP-binding protein [Deltaproteobacteria bacterium]